MFPITLSTLKTWHDTLRDSHQGWEWWERNYRSNLQRWVESDPRWQYSCRNTTWARTVEDQNLLSWRYSWELKGHCHLICSRYYEETASYEPRELGMYVCLRYRNATEIKSYLERSAPICANSLVLRRERLSSFSQEHCTIYSLPVWRRHYKVRMEGRDLLDREIAKLGSPRPRVQPDGVLLLLQLTRQGSLDSLRLDIPVTRSFQTVSIWA